MADLSSWRSISLHTHTQTRSQAVARIADRTASQQTVYKLAIVAKYLQLFSRYCVLSVTCLIFRVIWRHWSLDHSIPHRSFPIGGPLEPSLYISNGFGDIQLQMWRNGWYDVKRPLNKGQGYSFLYQSVPHIWFYVGCQCCCHAVAKPRHFSCCLG